MRVRTTYDIDRETKSPALNFDVYLFVKDDVDKGRI